ncbi:large subunit ribosomal protein L24e [Pelomyxa schiedti]|nr:large subunit ribosomal protein L24e [Pelomyxa schiedti]
MSMDTTFEFEKVRNRPVKYNRELFAKTLLAMRRIQAIKERREQAFYEKRMADAARIKKPAILAEIKKHEHLLLPPDVPLIKMREEREAAEREAEKQKRVARALAIAHSFTPPSEELTPSSFFTPPATVPKTAIRQKVKVAKRKTPVEAE